MHGAGSAFFYNLGYLYVAPLVLLPAYLLLDIPALLPISIIWLAHVSMDRMLGYGLKLDIGFKVTHLGTIGMKSQKPWAGEVE